MKVSAAWFSLNALRRWLHMSSELTFASALRHMKPSKIFPALPVNC